METRRGHDSTNSENEPGAGATFGHLDRQASAERRRLVVVGVAFSTMATYVLVDGGISELLANGENLVALTAGLFAALTLASKFGSTRRRGHGPEVEESTRKKPDSPGEGDGHQRSRGYRSSA
jgi:hypothetical protein